MSDNINLDSCIKFKEEEGIDEIIIDCWEIRDPLEVIDVIDKIIWMKKEYDVGCTINSIRIVAK